MDVGAARGRFESLTGLRFVAALLVFVHHVPPLWDEVAYPAWVDRFVFEPGAAGVSFFFVLSGFVLTYGSTDRSGARDFYVRRLSRVYPNHLAAALLAVPLGVSAIAAALNVSLLHAWSPADSVHFSLDSPSWSLSCEAFFYALFPAVVVWARSRAATGDPRRTLWWLIGGILVVQAGATLLAASDPSLGKFVGYISPPVRFLEFVLGIVLALAFASMPRLDLRVALTTVAAGLLLAGVVPQPSKWVVPTLLPFVATIVAAAQRDRDGLPSPLRSGALRALGAWSFAFYLLHQLVIRYFVGWTGWDTSSVLAAAVASSALLVVALGLSAAAFHLYEQPVERWIRQRATSADAGRRPVGR